jgi:hypothetical protein
MLIGMLAGCSSGSRYSMEPATTQPSYWMEQPGSSRVASADFDRLWAACQDVARDYLFKLDREDYRGGILTTQPMVSGQWFEPWRGDVRTSYDRDESSLATIRRTITFQFERTAGDSWEVTPKVLVERQAMAERRISSAAIYRQVFTLPRSAQMQPSGSREADQGIYLPQRYWYPLRRDAEFERVLAAEVQKRLQSKNA